MRKIGLLLIAAFCVGAFSVGTVSCTSDDNPWLPAAPGVGINNTLEGTVYDQNGNVLSGAIVTADANGKTYSVTTASNGEYSLTLGGGGNYSFKVEKDGYISAIKNKHFDSESFTVADLNWSPMITKENGEKIVGSKGGSFSANFIPDQTNSSYKPAIIVVYPDGAFEDNTQLIFTPFRQYDAPTNGVTDQHIPSLASFKITPSGLTFANPLNAKIGNIMNQSHIDPSYLQLDYLDNGRWVKQDAIINFYQNSYNFNLSHFSMYRISSNIPSTSKESTITLAMNNKGMVDNYGKIDTLDVNYMEGEYNKGWDYQEGNDPKTLLYNKGVTYNQDIQTVMQMIANSFSDKRGIISKNNKKYNISCRLPVDTRLYVTAKQKKYTYTFTIKLIKNGDIPIEINPVVDFYDEVDITAKTYTRQQHSGGSN